MFYEFSIRLIPVTCDNEIILNDAASNMVESEMDTEDKLFASNIIVVDKPLTIRERNKYVTRFIDDIIFDNGDVEFINVRSTTLNSNDERVERKCYYVAVKLGAVAFIPSAHKTKFVDKINRTKIKTLAKEAIAIISNGR